MLFTTSKDGTKIGYEQAGSGPPLIFVVGAFNDHTRCAALASALADRFSVITYDRRARGSSGDTRPYAVDREVEDLAALVDTAGGAAAVFGYSSGAVLALRAAADGMSIDRLVLFEPPFAFGGHGAPSDLSARLQELVDAGRNGDAVTLFQTEAIRLPAEVVAQIRKSPMFPGLEAMAQSVVYDSTITTEMAVPTPAMCAVTVPTMVLTGAETWPNLSAAAVGLAGSMPAAKYLQVPGAANHDIPVEQTSAIMRSFLG